MNYFNFDLLIEHAGENYRAHVLNSPAGQAVANFSLVSARQELTDFLSKMGRAHEAEYLVSPPKIETVEAFGRCLFEAVFHGEILGCLHRSLDDARRQEAGLRLRLRLKDVPQLADLPWEYLYDPLHNRFLSLAEETPIVRYLELPTLIQTLPVKPPLRILVMISSPDDRPILDVEQEWSKLCEALHHLEQRGLVALERLERATLNSLQRQLRKDEYHVFHFIGDGVFDRKTQDGILILEDDDGRGIMMSSHKLGLILADERTLRLAILNACEGARASRSDSFAGTAQSLVQNGIPAVIAMQFNISDKAAITFTHEFYDALADGYPVDAALAEARKAIFGKDNNIEWGTPVLYMRSPDGHIFDVESLKGKENDKGRPKPFHHKSAKPSEKLKDKEWGEDDWKDILLPIKYGKCTPFIGSRACFGVLPLGGDLAQEWAEAHDFPLEDSKDLARIAQFVAVKHGLMRPKFEIKEQFDKVKPPDFTAFDQPHSVLAGLPLPVYITTNYDDFLLQALRSGDKNPQQELCRWNQVVKDYPSIFKAEPGYNPTIQSPIVFHLHGHLEVPESLVLTEDDYLDFLVSISKDQDLIPPRIQRAFRETSLLFLGYQLYDWDFRVLFRSLASYLKKSVSKAHVSVQLVPVGDKASDEQIREAKDYLAQYFDRLNVRVYWGTCREFAAELRKQWKAFNLG